ncbi:MAG: hypothetical protein JW860_07130 [Sedimentisphaerales bacterium]|nr:hypothetical protein [Sedimentisphaerales bacterium]
MDKTFKIIILFGTGIGVMILTTTAGILRMPSDGVPVILLMVCIGLMGFSLGSGQTRPTEKNPEPQPAASPDDSREPGGRRAGGETNNDYLRTILDELSLMQNSNDLLYRYQCFIRMSEKVLHHVLGSCCVSLWCPDSEYKKLVECVIRDSYAGSSSSDKAGRECFTHHPARHPSSVPLDEFHIRESLTSGKSYLGPIAPGSAGDDKASQTCSLICHACIPLYREYGQPLLINVERTGAAAAGPGGRDHKSLRDDFDSAVDLIKLFWQHLQATNQRQWLIEHEPASGVLRKETFLLKAQNLAQRYRQQDELFSVVVLTVRGFRNMFAGQSGQWHQLSSAIGRCLNKLVREMSKESLLGRMADDVFAFILPRTNAFLAHSIMNALTDRLGQEMIKDQSFANLDIMAVDIQWSDADQTTFSGSMENMLDTIYRQLFRSTADRQHQEQRFLIHDLKLLELSHASGD